MIFGIGHDIVDNQRILKLIEQFGIRIAIKILSKDEIETFKNHTNQSLYLAKRYVGKEAFAKACGTGIKYPILMPSISIINDVNGKPSFNFDSSIVAWLRAQNITNTFVSLSDEKGFSSAVAILESN